MFKKGGTVSAKLCALQRFLYKTLNTIKKVKYKNFLHEVGRSWISEDENRCKSSSDDLQLPEKQTTPRGPKQATQADCLVISEFTNVKKLLLVGREKRSILQDCVKCELRIRSEVKLDTFVNSVLFHFTRGFVLRNTIQ
jgi:hypothetical protein